MYFIFVKKALIGSRPPYYLLTIVFIHPTLITSSNPYVFFFCLLTFPEYTMFCILMTPVSVSLHLCFILSVFAGTLICHGGVNAPRKIEKPPTTWLLPGIEFHHSFCTSFLVLTVFYFLQSTLVPSTSGKYRSHCLIVGVNETQTQRCILH